MVACACVVPSGGWVYNVNSAVNSETRLVNNQPVRLYGSWMLTGATSDALRLTRPAYKASYPASTYLDVCVC